MALPSPLLARVLLLSFLFLAAVLAYVIGFAVEVFVLVAIGAVLELVFWVLVLRKPGRRKA